MEIAENEYLHVLSKAVVLPRLRVHNFCLPRDPSIMVAQVAMSPVVNGTKPSGKQNKSKNQLRREKAKQKKAQQQPATVRLMFYFFLRCPELSTVLETGDKWSFKCGSGARARATC